MKTYTVIEVQECTRLRVWEYEVEAESAEDAMARAMDGGAKLVNEGRTLGDEDYGESGWAVATDGPAGPDTSAAEDAARDRLMGWDSAPAVPPSSGADDETR